MPGQLWTGSEGYWFSANLSDYLRMEVQPRCKFRQLMDAKDFIDKGLHRGNDAKWNVYSKISKQGGRLLETQPVPTAGFTQRQESLTVVEAANSVPYTGLLTALSQPDVEELIDKTLRDDCRKFHDIEAFNVFDSCALRVAPTGGNSATSLTLTTNGSTATTNNIEFGTGHHKALIDLMKERHIPAWEGGDDYAAITHPTTLRPLKNSLESVKQYTETGLGQIFRGEVGRYESCRFIEQDFIPKGGAIDSTTFDPETETSDPWNNAKSSWIFYFGADTGAEAIVIPEEIRAAIPGDFGRQKAIAWYYLGGYGISHTDALNSRIIKWDSAA